MAKTITLNFDDKERHPSPIKIKSDNFCKDWSLEATISI